MVSSVNNVIASQLFGGASSASGLGADLLAAYASAKAGIGAAQTAQTGAQDPNAPLATVWTPGLTPSAASLLERALGGKSFFDTEAKLYSDLGATGDYKKLFALHTGLSTLQALAARMEDDKLPLSQRSVTQTQFARGLKELEAFFATQQFEDVRLAKGDRVDASQTTLAIPATSEDYITPVMHKGSLADKVAGLDPDAKFDIVATTPGGTERRVEIDLAAMGSVPRSLGNVVSFINNALSTAGAATRLEVVNQSPKTQNIALGSKTLTVPYTGPRFYALKVDVRAGETVSFEPAASEAAFYIAGAVPNGARLIKLSDVDGEPGQTDWLDRPGATADPIGTHIGAGFLGAGAPYSTAPASAFETLTPALVSDGANNFETRLRAAGEAVLKLTLADGRTVSVTTAWRAGELEEWRVRAGETDDVGMLDDVAERLTQLLHEQGIAAGVDVWESGTDAGFSIRSGDHVAVSSLTIGGRAAALTAGAAPSGGLVGGLRAGVFARRFEADAVAGASDLFVGAQSFLFTTANGSQAFTIDGGEDGVDAATLLERLDLQMRAKGMAANVSLVDVAGQLTFRVDGLHDLTAVSATINEAEHDLALLAPGAWAEGGLPNAGAGEPFGDAVRTYNATGGSPLLTHTGALDIQIVVATPTGNKTISVQVTAGERASDPDPVAGQWSAAFQQRLDTVLNAAGVYVDAVGDDLTQWKVAEGISQRIASITVNGVALTLEADEPAPAIGGAFSVERSFTSALAATAVNDDVAALLADQDVSITFGTVWGEKTVSATLQPGDPRTLESAALRLNEALAAAGYDVGVVATALSGGGAGLRVVTGDSHTVRNVSEIALGGTTIGATLDPIDAVSVADDPVGALRVYERAARGASVTETIPSLSAYAASTANPSGWFPGRAFDVALGGGAKAATARAVATGPDGSVYVLADLDGDSATVPIKGQRDVALLKYDSAGKLAFSRILGASESASGFALAVSAEGKVAIAGSVTGGLPGAGTEKGGADSFVRLYDSEGAELWTSRRGATKNDEVRAIAFAPDGSVILSGRTESALGPALALGGSDAYVRGLSASSGLELFSRQFGTGGEDAATALLVRDDGSGGAEIFTGGVENNRGVVRSFTYSTTSGFDEGATRDIGYFYKGAINALAADGSSLYVGGEIGVDRLTLGAPARGAVAGQEGFVARLDADLVSTTLDRASYVGSAQDDSVTGLAVVGGAVYATGAAGGVIAGQGTYGNNTGFLTRLDDAGEMAWTRTFATIGGVMTPAALAADTSGGSVLDALALPKGRLDAADTGAIVQRSALRVGDELRIGADGRRLQTITVLASDTLASLVGKIGRAIGGAGRAELVRENGADRIRITAADGQAIRLEPGRAGKDALAGLGLNEGIIATNTTTRDSLKNFGLGLLASDLKLTDKAAITKAKAELSAAGSIVRQAYEALAHPNAKELTEQEKALQARREAAGAAPAYYTQQLANYQLALARLSGG